MPTASIVATSAKGKRTIQDSIAAAAAFAAGVSASTSQAQQAQQAQPQVQVPSKPNNAYAPAPSSVPIIAPRLSPIIPLGAGAGVPVPARPAPVATPFTVATSTQQHQNQHQPQTTTATILAPTTYQAVQKVAPTTAPTIVPATHHTGEIPTNKQTTIIPSNNTNTSDDITTISPNNTSTISTANNHATSSDQETYNTSDFITKDIGRLGRACEMSDAKTKQVLKIFYSVSQAEKQTNISRYTISRVCHNGGGIIGEYFFRFINNFELSGARTGPGKQQNEQHQKEQHQKDQEEAKVLHTLIQRADSTTISADNSTNVSADISNHVNTQISVVDKAPIAETTPTTNTNKNTNILALTEVDIVNRINSEINSGAYSNLMRNEVVGQASQAENKNANDNANVSTNVSSLSVTTATQLLALTLPSISTSALSISNEKQDSNMNSVANPIDISSSIEQISSPPSKKSKPDSFSSSPGTKVAAAAAPLISKPTTTTTPSTSTATTTTTITTTPSNSGKKPIKYSSSPSSSKRKRSEPSSTSVPPGYFDVTKLKPISMKASTMSSSTSATLPSSSLSSSPSSQISSSATPATSSTSPLKWIELYCKGLKLPVVNFMNESDAATALSMSKSIVRKMCEKSSSSSNKFRGGTSVLNDMTFTLQYLNGKSSTTATLTAATSSKKSRSLQFYASAYLYGSHKEDFTGNEYLIGVESYEKRMKRFKAMHKKDIQNKVSQHMRTTHEPKPTNEVPITALYGGQSIKDTSLTVTPVEGTEHLLNSDYQGLCILCQEAKAQIILNPCQHLLFCKKCASSGYCRKFCPVCRTSITSMTQVTYLKYVRPRIFSAYSFME